MRIDWISYVSNTFFSYHLSCYWQPPRSTNIIALSFATDQMPLLAISKNRYNSSTTVPLFPNSFDKIPDEAGTRTQDLFRVKET